MREPTYLILMALADQERHGYGIIQEVHAITGGKPLAPGTLYGALDRLGEEGLITATRAEVVDGRERRYYRLTDRGLGAFREETHRREELVRSARHRLGVTGAHMG